MTNVQLLNDKIKQSGLKKSFIAKRIGVSRSTFYSQIRGKSEFKASQINTLGKLLELDTADMASIFFTQGGA